MDAENVAFSGHQNSSCSKLNTLYPLDLKEDGVKLRCQLLKNELDHLLHSICGNALLHSRLMCKEDSSCMLSPTLFLMKVFVTVWLIPQQNSTTEFNFSSQTRFHVEISASPSCCMKAKSTSHPYIMVQGTRRTHNQRERAVQFRMPDSAPSVSSLGVRR